MTKKNIDLTTVGGRIKYKRLEAGLTQEQLADRLKAMPAIQLVKAEVMLAAPCTLSCSWYGYKYRYKR